MSGSFARFPLFFAFALLAAAPGAHAADGNTIELLKHFRSKSPKMLLVMLASAKVPLEELSKRSTVSVMSTAGAEFEGHVIAADEGVGSVTMLGVNGELIVLPYDRIEAVTIPNPVHYADVLAAGTVFRKVNEPVPGVLELERKMAEIGKPFSLTVGFEPKAELEQEAACRVNLKDLLDAVKGTLEAAGKSSVGQAALRSVTGVSLNHAAGATGYAAKKDGKVVRLTFDCKAALASDFRKKVEDSLNAAL